MQLFDYIITCIHTCTLVCASIVFIFRTFLFYWGTSLSIRVQSTPDNSKGNGKRFGLSGVQVDPELRTNDQK